MRTQSRLPRRLGVVAGLSAIAAMGMITAGCAKEEEKAPETSTTTTTSTTTSPAAPVSPTEKAPRIEPNAPNLFTPPGPGTATFAGSSPASMVGTSRTAPKAITELRRRLPALIAAPALVIASGLSAGCAPSDSARITGPFASLLTSSTELGPSRSGERN